MTYELLERLKESGFPLQPVRVEVGKETVLQRQAVVFSRRSDVADPGIYYVPSLSDLVEACGNHLKSMSRVGDGWACNQDQRATEAGSSWEAAETHAATLDDALAELWLTHRPTKSARGGQSKLHDTDLMVDD
jgi:hypothetical protein